MNKYLPIGSIVILRESMKTIMIYGRQQFHAETSTVYDYVACLYPEGNIDEAHTYLFDHNQIHEVVFTGYINNDEKNFLFFLEEEIKELTEEINTNKMLTSQYEHYLNRDGD